MEAKCSCQFCSGHVAFDSTAAGQIVACPHCGLETMLFIPNTPKVPTVKAAPQSVSVEIKNGMNPLGIASLVLGIGACVFCWIPFLGLLAIPLAAIGLLLAVIGITAAIVGKKSGLTFPVGGAVVCTVAILIALFVTGGISTLIAKGKQTNQEQVSNSGQKTSSSAAGEWSKSHIVKQGDVQVEIKRVSFPSDSPAIQIELSVENVSTTKKVDFAGWSGSKFDFDGSAASLTDNNQNKYKLIIDGAASGNAIYPRQAASDTLKFETPVDNIQWLHLELPAKNFGGSGMLRFEFSIDKIRAAIEEVKKAQADLNSFFANRPFETNADYIAIIAKIKTLDAEYKTLEESGSVPLKAVTNPTWATRDNMPNYINLLHNIGAREEVIISQRKQLYNQLSQIEQAASTVYTQKIEEAQSRLAAAETFSESAPH